VVEWLAMMMVDLKEKKWDLLLVAELDGCVVALWGLCLGSKKDGCLAVQKERKLASKMESWMDLIQVVW
jgi:hypothetical protein